MLFPPSLTIFLPSVLLTFGCLVSCVVLRWYRSVCSFDTGLYTSRIADQAISTVIILQLARRD